MLSRKPINIVYDMDGVLNQLNELVFDRLGILDKIGLTYYNIFENTHILSGNEIEKIIEMYNNPNVFRMALPVPGADRITDVYSKWGYRANVYVHSLCYNKGIRRVKEEWLEKNVGIPKNRMILEIGTSKSVLDTVGILIEDCLENLVASKATIAKILMDKTYNKLEHYKYDHNTIIRAKNLNSAISIVEEAVRYYERDTKYTEYGGSITGG